MSNNENINLLSGTEYKIIGKAMMERIQAYSGLPTGIKLDYQAVNGVGHIGFITTPGGKYLFQDIYGGFEAQLPFQVAYKLAGTGNKEMLDAETLLDGLIEYLEKKPYPSLTDGRQVTKIDFDSTTYRSQANEDGSLIFVRSGRVRYEKY